MNKSRKKRKPILDLIFLFEISQTRIIFTFSLKKILKEMENYFNFSVLVAVVFVHIEFNNKVSNFATQDQFTF